MKVLLPGLLGTLLLVAGSSATESPGSELARELLWLDTAHTEALFIPEAAFLGTSLDDLPLSARQKQDLQMFIAWRLDPPDPPLNRAGKVHPCRPLEEAPVPASAPSPLSITQALGTQETSLLGTIEAVVPGWTTRRPGVAEMAYLVVDRVLADPRHLFEVGDRVAVPFRGGTLQLEEATLCSERVPGRYLPAVGDRILVGGQYWLPDPRLIEALYVFPVDRDGKVHCEPYASVRQDCSQPLNALLGAPEAGVS